MGVSPLEINLASFCNLLAFKTSFVNACCILLNSPIYPPNLNVNASPGSCLLIPNPVKTFITVSYKSLLVPAFDKSPPIASNISSALLIVVGVNFLYA